MLHYSICDTYFTLIINTYTHVQKNSINNVSELMKYHLSEMKCDRIVSITDTIGAGYLQFHSKSSY